MTTSLICTCMCIHLYELISSAGSISWSNDQDPEAISDSKEGVGKIVCLGREAVC